MRKMPEENLKDAFAWGRQAHMRYLIFTKRAEKEGFKNIARLFRAIAYAEMVHASNHYNVLGMTRATSEILQETINGETFEGNEMYPAYNAVAKQVVEGNRDAQIGAMYVVYAATQLRKRLRDAQYSELQRRN